MQKELKETIDELTKNFETRIPKEEQEREKIVNAFKEELYFTVKAIEECDSIFISKDVNSIKSDLNRVAREFNEKNIDAIKQALIPDQAFEKIRKESIEIFTIAKNKINGSREKQKDDIANKIEKMEELLKDVKDYNQNQAKSLISEAILDLNYITNDNPNCLSLRLYHFVENTKNRGDER